MENTKLPLLYWLFAIHMLTCSKTTFSASELQRQLGHKRYQPIWEMAHKLRDVMGQRDDEYTLSGEVELDEGFFSTDILENHKFEKLKRGRGSQKKTKVLVMAESTESLTGRRKDVTKKVGHIKMLVLEDLKASTLDSVATANITPATKLVTDKSTSYTNFKDNFEEHQAQVIEPKEISKVLPWVHITISNAKHQLQDKYHGIKAEYLQLYLNEFAYRFNRRYCDCFDRLVFTGLSYRSKFRHQLYNHNAA